MQIFKKIISGLFFLFFFLILSLAATSYWAIKNPQAAWQIIEKNFLPKDLQITWSDIGMEFKHIAGLNFYFDLQIHNLNIQKEKPLVQAPIDYIRLAASVYPKNPKHKIVLHHWQLKALNEITLKPLPAKEPAEENIFETFRSVYKVLKSATDLVKLENVDTDVKAFRLLSDTSLPLNISVRLTQNAAPEPLKFDLSLQRGENFYVMTSGELTKNLQISANIEAQIANFLTSQTLYAEMNAESVSVKLAGTGHFQKDKLGISAQSALNFKIEAQNISGKIDVNRVTGLPIKLISLQNAEASFNIPLEPNKVFSSEPASVSLLVPIKLFVKDYARLKKVCACQIPQIVNLRATAQVWLNELLNKNPQKTKIATTDIEIEKLDNNLFSLTSATHVQFFKENESYEFSPEADFNLQIFSFKKLVRLLAAQKVLIPSPFDILDGTVSVAINGPVKKETSDYVIPAQGQARLKSKNQEIAVDLNSQINLNSKFKGAHIDVNAVIQKIKLVLPPLKPTQGKPRVLPDLRIHKEPAPAKKASAFDLAFTFSVATARPGAVQLYFEYFQPYLPLSVHISRLEDKTNTGRISLEPFNIVYLRRSLRVEKMNIQIPENEKEPMVVDGQLIVKQTQYMVFIDVQGPANKPQVLLSSQPYLPRSEIINVLLYDRTSEQLISADVETSGQVEAAVADRAIGLFGIWAFASTPIKGFSYNPTTKVYAATFAISSDVTASIGTNWESAAQVELRKRVSRRWMLKASWQPSEDEKPESSQLVLQWEKRF